MIFILKYFLEHTIILAMTPIKKQTHKTNLEFTIFQTLPLLNTLLF